MVLSSQHGLKCTFVFNFFFIAVSIDTSPVHTPLLSRKESKESTPITMFLHQDSVSGTDTGVNTGVNSATDTPMTVHGSADPKKPLMDSAESSPFDADVNKDASHAETKVHMDDTEASSLTHSPSDTTAKVPNLERLASTSSDMGSQSDLMTKTITPHMGSSLAGRVYVC